MMMRLRVGYLKLKRFFGKRALKFPVIVNLQNNRNERKYSGVWGTYHVMRGLFDQGYLIPG